MTQFQIHATSTFFFYMYGKKPRIGRLAKGAAWRGACTNSKREGLNEVRPGFRQPRIFPTRINGAQRGGVPSLQQQPRPPPANALPSQISGVQRRKGANLWHPPKRLRQPEGSTWRLQGGQRHLLRGPPGLGAGSSFTRCPHSPSPPTLRSQTSGLRMGFSYSLAPPRCDLQTGGEERGPLLQPRPQRSPPAGSDPCQLAWRWGLSSNLAHTTPSGGQESPSHPAAMETSLTPERPAGKVGVGLQTRLRR